LLAWVVSSFQAAVSYLSSLLSPCGISLLLPQTLTSGLEDILENASPASINQILRIWSQRGDAFFKVTELAVEEPRLEALSCIPGQNCLL
jgi:hypothetical protein